MWPENGCCWSVFCTCALNPSKPRRRSVTPAAIQIFVGMHLAAAKHMLIDGADVGVIERGCGAGLAAKAFECLTVAGQVFGKKLERNKAAQARILRPVNHAHSTATKLLHNAVVRESRVNHVATAWIRMVD